MQSAHGVFIRWRNQLQSISECFLSSKISSLGLIRSSMQFDSLLIFAFRPVFSIFPPYENQSKFVCWPFPFIIPPARIAFEIVVDKNAGAVVRMLPTARRRCWFPHLSTSRICLTIGVQGGQSRRKIFSHWQVSHPLCSDRFYLSVKNWFPVRMKEENDFADYDSIFRHLDRLCFNFGCVFVTINESIDWLIFSLFHHRFFLFSSLCQHFSCQTFTRRYFVYKQTFLAPKLYLRMLHTHCVLHTKWMTHTHTHTHTHSLAWSYAMIAINQSFGWWSTGLNHLPFSSSSFEFGSQSESTFHHHRNVAYKHLTWFSPVSLQQTHSFPASLPLISRDLFLDSFSASSHTGCSSAVYLHTVCSTSQLSSCQLLFFYLVLFLPSNRDLKIFF